MRDEKLAVQVTGLTKSYQGKTVLSGLDLSIKRGTVFGLLGANGAGKSTTIECILGTRRADSGAVSVLGHDPRKERGALFQRVGVQFQEGDYQPEIKVFELWLLTMVSTLSIGLMVGGIARNAKSASVIACLLYFPMLIFSGATLPLEVMPGAMQKIVSVFPLTQGIQLMKAAFLGLRTGGLWLPVAVMGAVTVICMGVAVKCFKWE